MTAYNFAQGGDTHYNPNMALYPQNALVKDRPEYGSSTTPLKPAHHWEGGHYAAVRHMSINDACHQCGLKEAAANLAAGDTFLSHIVPAGSLLTDVSYKIHTPNSDAMFTVQLASDGTVLGTVDGTVAGDGWLQLTTPVYVPCDTNEAIEWLIDAWPDTTPAPADSDPCGVYGPCPVEVDFCFTSTVFYKNARAENYCEGVCWDNCDC